MVRKWWSPFSVLKSLRVIRKWWSPFSVLKTLRQWRSPFSALMTLKAVRQSWSPFWVLESRKKVTESFFKDHASSSFYMMYKFPGTIFSLSVPTESLWLQISFFDYISLAIHFNLYEERCRVHFSKYCKSYFPTTPINGFT